MKVYILEYQPAFKPGCIDGVFDSLDSAEKGMRDVTKALGEDYGLDCVINHYEVRSLTEGEDAATQ